MDAALVAPELARRKQPLEAFPLDAMALVGSLVQAGKPVALIGASPGGFGTILAQDAWLAVLRTLGVSSRTQAVLAVGQMSRQQGGLHGWRKNSP